VILLKNKHRYTVTNILSKLQAQATKYNTLPAVRGKIIQQTFMATLKPQSNGPLYNNTVIGTLAIDGWAVTFGTARRGLGGLGPRPVPSSLYQM